MMDDAVIVRNRPPMVIVPMLPATYDVECLRESRPSASPHLESITLELTRRCNLQCRHCYCNGSPEADLQLDVPAVVKFVRSLTGTSVRSVTLTGGEPTLVPGVESIISAAAGAGLNTVLFTNGLNVRLEDIWRWADIGLKAIQVSVDGPAPVHDYIRNAAGSYCRAMATIDAARSRGLSVAVMTTILPENVNAIASLKSLFAGMGAEGWCLAPAIPTGRASYLARIPFGVLGAVFRHVGVGACSPTGTNCGIAFRKLAVSALGEFVPCELLPDLTLGTMNKDDPIEVLRSAPLLQEMREGLNGPASECVDCVAASQCKGGCRAAAVLRSGRVTARDYRACAAWSQTTAAAAS